MIALACVLLLVGAGVAGSQALPAAGPPLVGVPRPPAGLSGEGLGPIPLRLLPRYQDNAEPGGVARIETPAAAGAVLVRLLDGRGMVVARGASFRASDRWVSLVGVPSTTPPGPCALAIGVADGSATRWVRAPFRVNPRTFASEVIPLTPDLTTLRAAPDPRKDQEAVEMWRILSSLDPEALWEPGPFALPADASRRSAGYGDRRVYRYDDGSTDQSVHAGADIAVAEGSLVTACGRGRVVFAGSRIVTGGTVVVEHLPGVFSLYYHLSEVLVSRGQLLEKGQLLGAAGMTGLATGPHLHWELQVRGVAVDPDLFVRQAMVPAAELPAGGPAATGVPVRPPAVPSPP